jgi:hypothetical protein
MIAKVHRLTVLVFFALATLVGVVVGQNPTSAKGSVYADSCLVPSEFQLRGVELHGDGESAVHHLGKALRVKSDSGEDDGGRYERKTYYYRGVELVVVRGMVDLVATRARTTATPSGLRPGLDREAVRHLLTPSGVTFKQAPDTLAIGACSPEGQVSEDVMILTFDRTGRVHEVSISGP